MRRFLFSSTCAQRRDACATSVNLVYFKYIFLNMSEKKLIRLVKRHPALYNANSRQYKDNNIRYGAWLHIAKQLNLPVEVVKEKWAKLRNCFTNALKRRLKKNDRPEAAIVTWKYEKEMQFLLPHLKTNRNSTYRNIEGITVVTVDEDDMKEEISTEYCDLYFSDESVHSPGQLPNQSYDDIKHDKEMAINSSHGYTLQREPEMDEDVNFFLTMSKQLKKLPQTDQSEIKFKLHKLIHDSEMKMLKSKKRTLSTPTRIRISKTNNPFIKLEEDNLSS